MPPADWYTSPEIAALEKKTTWAANWLHVARSGQLDRGGSCVTGCAAGAPFAVARLEGGGLRAYHNVCRHRAARLVTESSGTVQQGEAGAIFRCPYHAWEYRVEDGRLVKAPRMGGVEGFRARNYGLKGMEVLEWGPLVFIRLAGNPAASADSKSLHPPCWSALKAQLDSMGRFSSGLTHVRQVTYDMACNWKVFVDNYLDGGYHVPVLHAGLSRQLDLDSYRTIIRGRTSVQTCSSGGNVPGTEGSAAGGDLEGRLGSGAAYAFLHPNLMINRYGPWLDTNTVVPLSHATCRVTFDYYVEEQGLEAVAAAAGWGADVEGWVEEGLATSARVQEEDVGICEDVQRGLESGSYVPGRYAPRVEHADHHFHCMLAEELESGLTTL
ncbi:unnamed protein product [Ostreobium quekettii]|uniref:Choline monooxygenase, chloroplastic n=1 Tax=Ostreobium quekettii TaxID=121088 RepID=A0A8S1JGB6_9CHLO|nr:unnamed protein product [Ostreobium quekettii]